MTAASHRHEPHNAGAGQGAVLLDVGGDAGAVVIAMPARLVGEEIEIRPEPCTSDEPLRHVGVVVRPTPRGLVPSAVFDGVTAGRYEFFVRPAGPVELCLDVRAGEVSFAEWPT